MRLVPLDTLPGEANFVTLHLPASAETARFVNRERLALMKPTAFHVKTARGALVDHAALCDALASGRLAGAGWTRSPKSRRHGARRLLLFPNVVLSLHSAASDQRVRTAALRHAVDSIVAAATRHDPGPGRLLNPDVLERAPPNRCMDVRDPTGGGRACVTHERVGIPARQPKTGGEP